LHAIEDLQMTKKKSKTSDASAKSAKLKRRTKKHLGTINPEVHAKIDLFMATVVPITEGPVTRLAPGLEVILHHLWHKMMAGSRKAEKLYWRYIKFYGTRPGPGGNPILMVFGPDQLTYEEVMKKEGRES
jgi:hypothetical protein